LKLYAPEFLARHRAEMLLNFEDLENNLPSKAAHWLFIGKDLMLSVISRNIPKSLWGQTVLMFIVLAVVLAVLADVRSSNGRAQAYRESNKTDSIPKQFQASNIRRRCDSILAVSKGVILMISKASLSETLMWRARAGQARRVANIHVVSTKRRAG
jgi:hypothetical protein